MGKIIVDSMADRNVDIDEMETSVPSACLI